MRGLPEGRAEGGQHDIPRQGAGLGEGPAAAGKQEAQLRHEKQRTPAGVGGRRTGRAGHASSAPRGRVPTGAQQALTTVVTLVRCEHTFEQVLGGGGVNTSSVLPAPRSWLTVGDPGPLPAPVTEPRHAEWCWCDAASSAPVPSEPASSEPASSEPLSSEPLSSEPLASGPLHWATPGVTPPPAGPSPLLAQLRSALDALAEHGPVSGSRADTATMLQLGEQARALALRELAEMDAVGGHQRPGVTSTTASWLRGEQHLTDGAARAAVGLATALRDDLPALGDLLAHGQVTVEHTAAVVAGVRGLDRDTVRDAEQGLCDLARLTDPVDVRKRLRDKAAAVDDRIARQAARRARERMGLRLNDVGPHTAVDGTLAGDDGATVRLAMALAVEADRQDGDARGKAARQADVLVGWARDYLAHRHGAGDSLADDARTVRTHLHVLCRPEQLAARPCTGTVGARLADLLRRDLAGEPPRRSRHRRGRGPPVPRRPAAARLRRHPRPHRTAQPRAPRLRGLVGRVPVHPPRRPALRGALDPDGDRQAVPGARGPRRHLRGQGLPPQTC